METPDQYTKIKHTPLPWFQSHCKNADGETYSTKVYDHQGVIAVLEWYPIALGEGVTGTRREANAEFIVTACNEYYALIKENERLRGTIGVECVKQLLEARNQNIMQSKCLSMINRCLNDGLTIEKDDPIHEVIKRLIP